MLKTAKTAGTSVEIALSKFLGPDDVITPIAAEDESQRKQLRYRSHQNTRVRYGQYSRRDLLEALLRRRRLAFYNHAPAEFVKSHLRPRIWDGYFKFAFERNPWDKAISAYWYRRSLQPALPSLNEYIAAGFANDIPGFDVYSIRGRIVVDQVFLYEDLAGACQQLAETVGLPEIPELPSAKSSMRQDRRPYKEVLSTGAADEIARAYAREIARYGYVF